MPESNRISGSHAIVGMDVVSFSRLSNDDQISLIKQLISWIKAALAYHNIVEGDYRWSPAGDGGYITLQTTAASDAAVDVAFSILDKATRAKWVPKGNLLIPLRFAVHAGTVEEGEEIGRTTNIWGEGINTAARILSICGESQILVSEQYFQQYIEGKPQEQGLRISSVYQRTVKHGVQVRVRNLSKRDLGISDELAGFRRWSVIGTLWQRTCQQYDLLIADCMNSNNPVAALAASKFLMSLDPGSPAADVLFSRISHTDNRLEAEYDAREHQVFSQMPPAALKRLIELATPRIFHNGDLICKDGDIAESCFFPVYGTIEVELNIDPKPTLGHGSIVGEFGLWIPGIRRTATLKAKDECLLLEINFRDFENIVRSYSGVGDAITVMIKQRILTYIIHSRQYFPDIPLENRERLVMEPSICEKYVKGTRLDLTKRTYIIFSGKVKIVTQSKPLEITAPGRFDHERVVGIVTQAEESSPDGAEAEVLEDCVAVSIPHESLRLLQTDYPSVDSAWNGLWGQRMAEIKLRRPASRK